MRYLGRAVLDKELLFLPVRTIQSVTLDLDRFWLSGMHMKDKHFNVPSRWLFL